MNSVCYQCGNAPRYLPYALCADCLSAERERERRAFERWLLDAQFKPAAEHAPYVIPSESLLDTKAEGKEA